MTANDAAAIRAAVERWQQAWNSGDMSSAIALFSEDADFINVRGSHWHGREQIATEHAQRHRMQLKGSLFSVRMVQPQQIDANVALVHIAWTIRGDHDVDGTPRQPRHGLFTWVMLKDAADCWWVRAAQNTHCQDLD